jgi:hypothetical protein
LASRLAWSSLAIYDGKLPSGKDETTDRQLMLQIVGALAGKANF